MNSPRASAVSRPKALATASSVASETVRPPEPSGRGTSTALQSGSSGRVGLDLSPGVHHAIRLLGRERSRFPRSAQQHGMPPCVSVRSSDSTLRGPRSPLDRRRPPARAPPRHSTIGPHVAAVFSLARHGSRDHRLARWSPLRTASLRCGRTRDRWSLSRVRRTPARRCRSGSGVRCP